MGIYKFFLKTRFVQKGLDGWEVEPKIQLTYVNFWDSLFLTFLLDKSKKISLAERNLYYIFDMSLFVTRRKTRPGRRKDAIDLQFKQAKIITVRGAWLFHHRPQYKYCSF